MNKMINETELPKKLLEMMSRNDNRFECIQFKFYKLTGEITKFEANC